MSAQFDEIRMRYQPIPAANYIGRRRRLAAQLPAGSVAVIGTNPRLPRSGDTFMPYRPNSDFYYLTGIDQPEAVLVLTTDDEWLFVKPTDEISRLWNGDSYSREQAATLSGISQVAWTTRLPYRLRQLSKAKRLGAKPLADFVAAQRVIKDEAELGQIRHAIKATAAGFTNAHMHMGPDRREYAIEAQITAGFISCGAQGHAYEPIVASGPSATVLHYTRNDRQMQAGELVLIDAGAEYGWYAADVTRTFAVSRSMTERQKAVYDAVHSTQQAVIAIMKPGVSRREVGRETVRLITERLIDLGLLKAAEVEAEGGSRLYRRYYPHGVSHYLGLDVHDAGEADTVLEPGMVLTCEPGIYISEEGIGVRIEDDILITPDGNEVLTAAIPS